MVSVPADEEGDLPIAYELGKYFAHLTGDSDCLVVNVDDRFWDTGVAALPPGRLVSMIESERDWSSWERHPKGEELIIQIDGVLVLILDKGGAHVRVPLHPGEFAIVPRGMWHTADVPRPGRAVYITPGDGTDSRRRAEG